MYDDYYNTNGESGQELADSRERNRRQQTIVLAHFQRHPNLRIAPHQVPVPEGTPLTSVRRALNNLTQLGLLEKTDYKVPGTMGRNVYTWQLRRPLAEPQGKGASCYGGDGGPWYG